MSQFSKSVAGSTVSIALNLFH